MTLALTDPRLTDTGLQADGVLEMWYASIDDMEQSLASDQAQKARLPAERGISAMGLDRTGNPVRLLKRLVAALATLALLQFVLEIVPPAEAQACGCAPENYCPYPTGEAQRMRQTLKDLARARGVPERLMPVFDGIEGCERCFEAAQVVQVSWTVDARKYREKYGQEPPVTNGFDTWRPDLELTLRKLQQEGVVGWISIRSLGAGCRCCRPGEARPPDPPPGDGPGIDVASGGSMPPDLLDPAKPVYENPADAEEALTGRRIVRREPERFSEPRERDIHPVCAACRAMADERNLLASAYNDLLRALNEQSREVFDLGRELNRFFSLRGGSEAGNRIDAASDDAIVATGARAVRREYEALAASYARKARRFEEMKAERVVVRSKLDDLLARIESCEKGEACKPRPAPLPPLARVTCPSGQSIMGLALTYRSCGACQKLADEAGEAQYRELCAGQKNLNANVEFTRQLERLVSEAGGPDKVKDNPDIARRISELAAQHRRESLEPTAAERAAMKVRSDAATAAFLACVPSCGEPFRVFERDTGREINPAPDSIGRR